MKPTLVAGWFGASFLTLLLAVFSLIYLSIPKIVQPNIQSFKLYAALPKTDIKVFGSIGIKDARAKIVEDFFKEYKAPLAAYSETFIKIADKYKLDYRLLPSIAMQESNGGRKIINNSYNPFGYGIYGKLVIKFTTWEDAIDRVGRALREDYLDQELKNPTQIMAKYTPPSLEKGGTWAKGVSSFMEELR